MRHSCSFAGSSIGALLAVGVLGLPRPSAAQVRVSALAGIAHMDGTTSRVPSAPGALRLEGSFGLLPWIHLGAYVDLIDDLPTGTTGLSYGALAALRPTIPGSPLHPLAFASLGYLRYPSGGSTLTGAWNAQLGGGLAFRLGGFVDLEARVAWVRLLEDGVQPLTGQGYTVMAGLALHP